MFILPNLCGLLELILLHSVRYSFIWIPLSIVTHSNRLSLFIDPDLQRLGLFQAFVDLFLSDVFGKLCMSFFLLYNHYQVYYLVENDRMSISILSN
jgi:hypothetical protein